MLVQGTFKNRNEVNEEELMNTVFAILLMSLENYHFYGESEL